MIDDMVDVIVGPMSLDDLTNEVYNVVFIYNPESINISMDKTGDKYMTHIYIPKKDFYGRKEL